MSSGDKDGKSKLWLFLMLAVGNMMMSAMIQDMEQPSKVMFSIFLVIFDILGFIAIFK